MELRGSKVVLYIGLICLKYLHIVNDENSDVTIRGIILEMLEDCHIGISCPDDQLSTKEITRAIDIYDRLFASARHKKTIYRICRKYSINHIQINVDKIELYDLVSSFKAAVRRELS